MNASLKHHISCLVLLLTALIWGLAFAFQRDGLQHISPAVLCSIRNILSWLFLLCVAQIMDRFSPPANPPTPKNRRRLWIGGLFSGLALALSILLQSYGLRYLNAGKASFLTALYIIFVPFLSVLLKRRILPAHWVAAFLAVTGMYLLCAKENIFSSFSRGEGIVLLCAVGYAFHILVVDHFAGDCDCIRLSAIQFLVAAIISFIVAICIRESFSWNKCIRPAIIPILYTGILSGAIGFTLQNICQRFLAPSETSTILSLESVFGVLGGMIILHETLSGREILGCAVIFLAVLLSQLPEIMRKNPKQQTISAKGGSPS